MGTIIAVIMAARMRYMRPKSMAVHGICCTIAICPAPADMPPGNRTASDVHRQVDHVGPPQRGYRQQTREYEPRSRRRTPSRKVPCRKKVASYGPLYVKGEKNPFLPDSSQSMPWS